MPEDERGMPRIVGIARDIGAYEANNEIFGSGFDGSCS